MFNLSYFKEKYNSKGPRTKGIILGSSSLVISQAVNVVSGFFITAMLTRYLLPEEFGLWSIIMSLTGIFGGIDFGFANALRNKLSQLYVDKDKNDKESQLYYFSVFYVFILWAMVVTLGMLILKPFINWESIFKTNNYSIIEYGSILFVLGASLFAFNLAFTVSTVGFFSYQESHWNAVISMLSKFLLLILTFIFIKFTANLIVLNLMFLILTLFSTIVSFSIFNIERKWKLILIKYEILKNKLKELFSKSLQFVLLQIVAMIHIQIDVFIISKIFGLEMVGDFSIVKKLYLIVSGFHFSFLMPMWSAYTEAIESKDYKWVKKILKKSILYSLILFLMLTVFLTIFGPDIVYIWTGKRIIDVGMYFLLGIFFVISSWNNSFSVFLNSRNILMRQIVLLGLGVILLIPLSIYFSKIFGIDGVCLALILTSLPLAISNPIQVYKFIKRNEKEKLNV